MPPTPSAKTRWMLKEATAAAHERLDASFARYDLARPEDYGDFLSVSAAALLPLEGALERDGIEAALPDWPRRRRRDALVADLGGLEREAPMPALPERRLDAAELLGAVYVLEGSRLGGRLLLKRAQLCPDDAVRANLRYLGHGNGEGLWTRFLQELHSRASGLAASGMIAGALFAFTLFERAAEGAAARGSRPPTHVRPRSDA